MAAMLPFPRPTLPLETPAATPGSRNSNAPENTPPSVPLQSENSSPRRWLQELIFTYLRKAYPSFNFPRTFPIDRITSAGLNGCFRLRGNTGLANWMTGIPLEEWSTVEAEGMMLRGDIEFQLVKLPVAATEVNVEAAKRVHRQQLLIFHHLRKAFPEIDISKVVDADKITQTGSEGWFRMVPLTQGARITLNVDLKSWPTTGEAEVMLEQGDVRFELASPPEEPAPRVDLQEVGSATESGALESKKRKRADSVEEWPDEDENPKPRQLSELFTPTPEVEEPANTVKDKKPATPLPPIPRQPVREDFPPGKSGYNDMRNACVAMRRIMLARCILSKFPCATLAIDKVGNAGYGEYVLRALTTRAQALLDRETIWDWPRTTSTVALLKEMIENQELYPMKKGEADPINSCDYQQKAGPQLSGALNNSPGKASWERSAKRTKVGRSDWQLPSRAPKYKQVQDTGTDDLHHPTRDDYPGTSEGYKTWVRALVAVRRQILAGCILRYYPNAEFITAKINCKGYLPEYRFKFKSRHARKLFKKPITEWSTVTTSLQELQDMVNEGDIKCVHDADDFDPDPHHSAREPSDDSNLEDVSGEKATDLTTSTIFEHPNRDTFPAGKDGYSQYWLECIRVWRDVLLYCILKDYPDTDVEASMITNLGYTYGGNDEYRFQANSPAAAELFRKPVYAWSASMKVPEVQRMIDARELVCVKDGEEPVPSRRSTPDDAMYEEGLSPTASRSPTSVLSGQEKLWIPRSRSIPRTVSGGEHVETCSIDGLVTIDNSLPAAEWRSSFQNLLRNRQTHIDQRAAQNAELKRQWEEEERGIEAERDVLRVFQKKLEQLRMPRIVAKESGWERV